MDRDIDIREVRSRQLRRVVMTIAAVAISMLIVSTLFGMLRPGVPASEIRTAVVERGPVTEVIDATGTVVPAFEKVLSAPVEARVVEILSRPGANLAPGDPILRLDTTASRLSVDRLSDRVAQKKNERMQLRLTIEKEALDLETRAEQQKLDAEVLQHRLDQRATLRAEGLISEEQFRQAEAESRKATLGREQLLRQLDNTRRSGQARLDALAFDLSILNGELEQAERELELATAKADRAGVLTWVVAQEGITLRRGEIFARIADQTSYRVEATTSDIHASRLTVGSPVEVRSGKTSLKGHVALVNPAIENGAVQFEVQLDDPSNKALRNSLRVEVSVLRGERDDVLKIQRGPFATGAKRERVFVVDGDKAMRRDVEVGAFGRDEIEIVSGLAAGDVVIISNTSEFRHSDEIRISGR